MSVQCENSVAATWRWVKM